METLQQMINLGTSKSNNFISPFVKENFEDIFKYLSLMQQQAHEKMHKKDFSLFDSLSVSLEPEMQTIVVINQIVNNVLRQLLTFKYQKTESSVNLDVRNISISILSDFKAEQHS